MALIPPAFVDCVVAIGTADKQGNRQWVASGFLYGKYVNTQDDGKKQYEVYLVSNRHVFADMKECVTRFNPQSTEPAHEYWVNLVDGQGSSAWTGHPKPEVDVAVIQVNFQQLKEDAMQAHFFRSDVQTATIGRIRELGITEGDFAYVLGFPMGLIVGQQSAVIVRSGSIARMRGILSGASDTFLVDAFVFPGNSGGPVILKPDVIAIAGTKPQQNALLIGIVQAYVPYTDVAISLQTQQPRVVFQENSGLTSVHAVDHIEETIEAAKGKDLGVYSGTA